MITKEVDNINRCCLYANDFHLEMILLPYIKKNLCKSEFVILTQNNLKDTIKVLLEKVNLSKNDIDKLCEIDWSIKTKEKIKEIKEYSNNKNKVTVVINGNIDFVKENIEIINSFNKNNIEIIECYNVEDLKSSKINIDEYEILNTKRI